MKMDAVDSDSSSESPRVCDRSGKLLSADIGGSSVPDKSLAADLDYSSRLSKIEDEYALLAKDREDIS